MSQETRQLISYIAPAASATRRPATGSEPFLRPVMYTPTDLVNKSLETIRADLERVARDYAPCDIVVGDIEAGTPDERIMAFLELCSEINRRMENL